MAKFKPRDIFFWSDQHFYHKHAIRHNKRPFESTEAMNEALVANYNSVVKPQDTCIWVGDAFFCGSTKAKAIMDRLNGTKVLVSGNHDGSVHNSQNCGFDFVCEKLTLKICDQEVNVSHYPYAEPFWFTILKKLSFQKKTKYLDRRIKNKGGWLIHGHTHSKFKLREKEIHVGVDACNYRPVHISVIEDIIKTGKLQYGQIADNRFKYNMHGLVLLGHWLKGIKRLWRNKTRKERFVEDNLSEETAPGYAEPR